MAQKSGWKLQFDPSKWEVVLPPMTSTMERVYRTIGDGPNMQVIEHCHFADTMENLHSRAPTFHMRIPISDKGQSREWPKGDVGQHIKIKLPVAILSSERKGDHMFFFTGSIKVTFPSELGRWLYVDIHNYSVSTREGGISMRSDTYVEIVQLWQRHFFETS